MVLVHAGRQVGDNVGWVAMVSRGEGLAPDLQLRVEILNNG
jgi:hypothetical protein